MTTVLLRVAVVFLIALAVTLYTRIAIDYGTKRGYYLALKELTKRLDEVVKKQKSE